VDEASVGFGAGLEKDERAGDVGVEGFRLMGFTPVDVGAAGFSGTVDDYIWFVFVEFVENGLKVADIGLTGNDRFSLVGEELLEMLPKIASWAGDKKFHELILPKSIVICDTFL